MKRKECGLESYQAIMTPEEEEERRIARQEREERRCEVSEYRAEVARDMRGEK